MKPNLTTSDFKDINTRWAKLTLITFLLLSLNSCQKDEPKPVTLPSVATTPISTIAAVSASSGGIISIDGGGAITARGIVWSTTIAPTTSLTTKTTDGTGTGSFTSNLTGLSPATTYYVRAYATNSSGTAYGEELNFTTATNLPTISTNTISNITTTSALGGGNISNDGGGAITTRGIVWSITTAPTTSLTTKTMDGTGTGSFASNLTGLSLATIYYVRAYATNSSGTAYGEEINFITSDGQIGQSYGGGLIFYLDNSNKHGLIAAPFDQNVAIWSSTSITTNATEVAIGTGQSNTTAIVAAHGSGNYAAFVCDQLVLNGYSDWYLPSIDELNALYTQKTVVGGFVADHYWSSTEPRHEAAWGQSFSDGSQNQDWGKGNSFSVRAIRAF